MDFEDWKKAFYARLHDEKDKTALRVAAVMAVNRYYGYEGNVDKMLFVSEQMATDPKVSRIIDTARNLYNDLV